MPSRNDDKYSSTVGLIFLFNLIVGTGALALPGALQTAGWVIGVVLLITLGLVSFITVTFIVECLAIANAVSRKLYGERAPPEGDRQRLIEQTPLVERDAYEITEKYELGQMGVMMSPKWCQIVIYGTLCLYLFGDLAIYAVVFGKTWANVLCTYHPDTNETISNTLDLPCSKDSTLTGMSVYRISVAVFIAAVGPFAFFNFQKTKFLQVFTGVLRWVAFFIMLCWSIEILFKDGRKGYPAIADLKALPTLFGTVVYSFMCQHSIPSLIQPIRTKSHLKFIIPLDYSLAAFFYLALCLTAIFTFEKVNELYTINFWEETSGPSTNIFLRILAYYLALFPVFTLSTNFPMLAITLRNNFRAMILRDSPKRWYYDQFLFPLIIILPPTALALTVFDIHLLVGIIGSYCGTCVQYLIPCLLVTYARRQALGINQENKYASPFRAKGWVYAVYVWMLISLGIITYNYTRMFL